MEEMTSMAIKAYDENRGNRLAVVAVARNEQDHIAEWVLYHLEIGFDSIIVYDNSSTDATREILTSLARRENVKILDWPYRDANYQMRAYNAAVEDFGPKFDWMAFIDVDEFIVTEEGQSIRRILQDNKDHPALAISWCVFGSNDHGSKPEGLLIDNFTKRADISFGPNRHIKSIVCPAKVIRCINPHFFEVHGSYRDLNGNEFSWVDRQSGLKEPDYSRAKLHHYFVKSRKHWADKMARGYHDIHRETALFDVYNRNEVIDVSAGIQSAAVSASLTKLDVLVAGRERIIYSEPHFVITNHNTALCADVETGMLTHRPLNDLDGAYIVVLEATRRPRLVVITPSGRRELDPSSLTFGRVVSEEEIVLVARGPSIAFSMPGGRFLSARPEDGSFANVSWLDKWEDFTVYSEKVFRDLRMLASSRWIARQPSGMPRIATLSMNAAAGFELDGETYVVKETLPLEHSTKADDRQDVRLVSGGWRVKELLRFEPLVYCCFFGGSSLKRQMELMLRSLVEIGLYGGHLLIIVGIGQDESAVLEVVPPTLRPHTSIRQVAAQDRVDYLCARLLISSFSGFERFAPALYLDLDVIVDQPIEQTLIACRMARKYSAQIETFNPLETSVPTGAELFRQDNVDIRGLFGFNSGIFSIPDMRDGTRDLALIRHCIEAYFAQNGRHSLHWNDQPMANYVLRKLDVFDPEPLTSRTRIPLPIGPLIQGEARGFVHFWPYDGPEAKSAAMNSYLDKFFAIY